MRRNVRRLNREVGHAGAFHADSATSNSVIKAAEKSALKLEINSEQQAPVTAGTMHDSLLESAQRATSLFSSPAPNTEGRSVSSSKRPLKSRKAANLAGKQKF